MGHIRDEKAKEDVQLLDFPCQDGILIDNTINDCIGGLIDAPDFHNVDALLGCRANGDELAPYILTST